MASKGWGNKTTHCWREVVDREKAKHHRWNIKNAQTYDSEASAARGWNYEWLDSRDSFGLPHYCFLTKKGARSRRIGELESKTETATEEHMSRVVSRNASARGKSPPPNTFTLGLRNTPGTDPVFEASGELSPGNMKHIHPAAPANVSSLPPLDPLMPPQSMGLTMTAPKGVPAVRTPRGRIAPASNHTNLFPTDNDPMEQKRGRTRHNLISNIITASNDLQHHWKGKYNMKHNRKLADGSELTNYMTKVDTSDCEPGNTARRLEQATADLSKMSKTANFYKGGHGIVLNNTSLVPL